MILEVPMFRLILLILRSVFLPVPKRAPRSERKQEGDDTGLKVGDRIPLRPDRNEPEK